MVQRLIGGQLRAAQLPATWSYNNEGKVTQIQCPSRIENSWPPRTTQARYTYDSMGRSNAVEWRANITGSESWSSIVSGVTYNAFGAVTRFNHLGQTETRQYNPLGQLTRITQGTANDDKITLQKNWPSTTAGAQSWGLRWNYDGFGSHLAQNVTQGTGPTHAVLVNANNIWISSAGYRYDLNRNAMSRGGWQFTVFVRRGAAGIQSLIDRGVHVIEMDFPHEED